MSIRICRKCGKDFFNKNNSVFCETCRTITRQCAVCKKDFITRPSLKKHVMTCSRKCGVIYQNRNVIQKRINRREPCAYCGAPITRRWMGYGKRKPKHTFCSRECFNKWRIGKNTGEQHPRWKGGTYDYYGNLWRKNRSLARKRDKVCQRCGKTQYENGKALDVHHIIPFRNFGIDRQEEAHKLENLICYCSSCHQIVEWDNLKT